MAEPRRGMLPLDEALPMEGRATFLPFRDTLPGSVMNEREWALPGMLAGAWNAFTAPRRAAIGALDPTSQEGIEEAMNIAGYAMTGGMPGMLTGAAPTPSLLGMNVWHGSPHKFDRFDASKIGTGEGAQAYGHGLYLAENPSVARSYMTSNPDVAGDLARWSETYPDAWNLYLRDLHQNPPTPGGITGISFADDIHAVQRGYRSKENLSPETVSAIRNAGPLTTGSLYKVDLPDEMIPKMLDWDKPLSQQPALVQQRIYDELTNLGVSKAQVNHMLNSKTGREAYQQIGNWLTDARGFTQKNGVAGEASEWLRSIGIPGIRYLDQGSRSAGKGTSNYVVFPGEEGMLKILERDGLPLAPALEVKNYSGRYGDRSHLTRKEEGLVPVEAIKSLLGEKGELRGQHRNRQGPAWEAFKEDIRKNGIREPILIIKDVGKPATIYEGNHRLDAALELGMKDIPAEIRYFGRSESDGLVLPAESYPKK